MARFTPVRQPQAGAGPETHAGPGPQADDASDPMTLGIERATLLGQSETPGWQLRADGSLFWAHTVLTALHDPDAG